MDAPGTVCRKSRKHGRGRLVFVSLGAALLAGALLPASAGAANTAVIMFHHADQSPPSGYRDTVKSEVFGDATVDRRSVAQYYSIQSYGRIKLTGRLFPPTGEGYQIPGSYQDGCQIGSTWYAEALDAASQDGFSQANFAHLIILDYGDTQCAPGAGGPGSPAFINSLNRYTIDHELGHTYGAPHANSYRCTQNGVTVAYAPASNCVSNEYGDQYDPMGSGGWFDPNSPGESIPFEMEPWRKLEFLHAMTSASAPTIKTPGIHAIKPLERANGTRMLRLPAGHGKVFDLSYRQPIHRFDAGYKVLDTNYNPDADFGIKGVLINLDAKGASGDNSQLIDTTPATDATTDFPQSGFEDAPLAVRRTFFDYYTGVKVKTLSATSDDARVKISYGDGVTSCDIPQLKGKTVSAAKSALESHHCRLGTVTRRPSGAPSGHVISQSPAAGRHLYSRSKVAVVVSS